MDADNIDNDDNDMGVEISDTANILSTLGLDNSAQAPVFTALSVTPPAVSNTASIDAATATVATLPISTSSTTLNVISATAIPATSTQAPVGGRRRKKANTPVEPAEAPRVINTHSQDQHSKA